jgi:hypothetical protein
MAARRTSWRTATRGSGGIVRLPEEAAAAHGREKQQEIGK